MGVKRLTKGTMTGKYIYVITLSALSYQKTSLLPMEKFTLKTLFYVSAGVKPS